MTRPAAIGVGLALFTSALMAQDATTFKDDNARDLFTRARFAVGASRVPHLTALTMRGKSRIAEDNRVTEADTEIRILLPDCYLRIDAAGRSIRRTGFCDKDLLTSIVEQGEESRPPQSMASTLLKSEQARLARLLLGAATYVSSRHALTFRSKLEQLGPNPGGGVDAGRPVPFQLEVSGQNNFGADVVFDSATSTPSRIDAAIGKRTVSTVFSDRREVSGLKLPFRMTSTTDGKPVDDLLLDQVVVNSPLTQADFKR